jgi:hypothetical protein
LLAGLGLALTVSRGQARTEADPAKDYHITPEVGPWMICVTSYVGPEAAKMAHDLCLELRSRYHLPAWVFNRGAEERRAREEEVRRRRAQQLAAQEALKRQGLKADVPLRIPRVRVEEQYAVLVGGFRDMDAARKQLDHIKQLETPKSVPLDSIGTIDRGEKNVKPEERYQPVYVNPFKFSFVAPNPTVKVQHESEKPDPALKSLNAHESYSLLQVKKPWTLVVKDFQGATVLQPQAAPDSLLEKLLNRKDRSMLEAGAKQAHEVAKVLRDMHMEAYVLHTRWSSIVTVGSYDAPDDPRLLQNQKMLAGQRLSAGIEFFARPLPMPVPHF